MEFNDSVVYSCYDNNFSNSSITPEFWEISDKERSAALCTALFTLFFIVVGLPSNALIVISILIQRLYKEPTLILLLNLAIADFLVCALVMPFTVVSGLSGGFALGDSDADKCKWCRMGVLFVALCLFSLHVLALVSLDRFIFVKFPMKYHRTVTVRRTVLCVLLLWTVCIAVSMAPIFGFGDVYFGHPHSTCSVKIRGETRITKNLNYFIFLVAESLMPLTILFTTNIWLACIVQKQIRKIYFMIKQSLPNDKEQISLGIMKQLSKDKNRKQVQLMRVFGAILISNVITWLPFIGRVLIVIIKGNDDFPPWVYVFVYLSLSFTAVLHPLIQASLIPEIRTYCKYLIVKTVCWYKCLTRQSSPSRPRVTSKGSVTGISDPQKKTCFCFDFLSATVLPNEDINNIVAV